MSLAQLQTLLADEDLSPDTIGLLLTAANDWYRTDPTIASFIVRALFRELSARGWGDEQGVQEDLVLALEAALLPPLHALLNSLNTGSKGMTDALDVLVKACHDHLS
jgi:hypothetical protein